MKNTQLREKRTKLAAAAMMLVIATPSAMASIWSSGGTGNWSSDANPGWDGTGVPNSQGAVAEITGSTGTTTQDIVAGVTVGTIERGGSSNASWTIAPTNTITLDQDGVGAGRALIRNSVTAVGGHRLNINAGTLVLADDLLVSNTGNSNSTTGSIVFQSNITGTGNITIDNVSNATAGQIAFRFNTGSSFTGNVNIRSGQVVFDRNTQFGNQAGNTITLGAAGQGSASLLSLATLSGAVVNNIVVASGSGGTLLLGDNVSNTGYAGLTDFSGLVTLNGDLSLTSVHTGPGRVVLSNTVSGAGSLNKVGVGIARISGVNTYTGDTTIAEGTLEFTSAGEQRFVIQDGDLSNSILGVGAVDLDGLLRIDISGLTATAGTWNLVDVDSLTESWGSGGFGLAFVGGPAFLDEGGGVFSSGDWSFTQSTGDLVLVPEPGSMALVLLGIGFIGLRRRAAA